MIDRGRVLQPIRETEDAIRRLSDYASANELGEAVVATWGAVDRALRRLLRGSPTAPDAVRLVALSPSELPTDRLIEALRREELISLRLAGLIHELSGAATRALRGEVRAADADLAQEAVVRLTEEVEELTGARERGAAPEPPLVAVGPEPGGAPPPAVAASGAGPRVRSLTAIAAAIAGLALLALILVVVRPLDDRLKEGMAAFREGRDDDAELLFREVVESAPENVTAHLYLARIYRRDNQYQRAAEHLRAAAAVDPKDPDVRRELGHLFMDLNRPGPAAEQYRRALEAEPESVAGWIGLIRALRAMGDPSADEVLRRAPAEVRAALDTGRAAPGRPGS